MCYKKYKTGELSEKKLIKHHNVEVAVRIMCENVPDPKGQKISEWIYVVIISPKIWTKNLYEFLPCSAAQYLVHIVGEMMTS